MSDPRFSKLSHGLQVGDEVLVAGDWYPVIGIALMHSPSKPLTGSLFTSRKYGAFDMGYRIDVASVEDARRPAGAA